MTKLTIQKWNREDKPREKFIEKGAENLSNAELLAILLRSGSRDENAVDLARKMLSYANNKLTNIREFSIEDLKRFNGVGETKAITIMATFELLKRIELESSNCDKPQRIYSSKSAAAIIMPIIKSIQHEECWVLYLNRANKLLSKERLSIGGVNSTVMDIKIIIKSALSKLASSIILIHNHPSGNKYPGEQDKIQTKRLKDAALLCDIELLDHLIIAGNNYYSFLDEGIL